MHALNELCIEQQQQNEHTQEALVEYFLNYCATHPEAEIDSDTAYQVAVKSRIRASGYHYLGNLDWVIFVLSARIIKPVMQSAAEAECGGLYMNAKEAVPMRITLDINLISK